MYIPFLLNSIINYYLPVGAPIAGLISDRTVIWWQKEKKGDWYPEDRLRASLIPLALIVPLPVIAFGFINKFVDGSLGLGLSLLCLFINGIGVSTFHGTIYKRIKILINDFLGRNGLWSLRCVPR